MELTNKGILVDGRFSCSGISHEGLEFDAANCARRSSTAH